MSNIRVVLFDIGNVLMLADHRRTIEAYVRLGVPRELAEGYFHRPDYAATGRGELSWLDYCHRLREEWGVDLGSGLIRDIDGSHIYAVDHGVIDLIDRVSRQAQVGFVTNTRYPEWERYVELEDRFDGEFVTWSSAAAGRYKADPGAFQSILSVWIPCQLVINIQPEEVFFIDDSAANCQAAAAVGIQTFHYTERQPWELEKRLAELGLL